MANQKVPATRKQFELAVRYSWGDSHAKILMDKFNVPILIKMTAERMFTYGVPNNMHAGVIRSILIELEENGFIDFVKKGE